MSISLQKGNSINLNKTNEGLSLAKGTSGALSNIHIGLGWDVHSHVNADLDAFVVQLGENNKELDRVYFGKKQSKDGAIRHSGDNLTGAGEGDDEVITVTLNHLSSLTKKVVVAVNIYQCRTTFANIENAFVRILNQDTGDTLMRYDLSNDKGRNYAVVMGEIVKNDDGTWDFNALGEMSNDRNIDEVVKRITQSEGKKGLFGKLFG